jgi:hypothetical protein
MVSKKNYFCRPHNGFPIFLFPLQIFIFISISKWFYIVRFELLISFCIFIFILLLLERNVFYFFLCVLVSQLLIFILFLWLGMTNSILICLVRSGFIESEVFDGIFEFCFSFELDLIFPLEIWFFMMDFLKSLKAQKALLYSMNIKFQSVIGMYRRRCYLWSISKHPIGSRFSKYNWFLYLCRFGLMDLNDFLLRQYLFNTIKILHTTEISYTSSTHESNRFLYIDRKILMPVNRVGSWYVEFSRYMYRPKWYMKIPGDIFIFGFYYACFLA